MRIAIQKVFLGFRSFHCGVNSCDSFISTGLMIQTEVSFSCHCLFGQLNEMPGAKEQNRAIIFKFCGVPIMGGSIC